METKQIPARDIQEHQQLTAVPGETLRRRKGVWPTVTSRAFLESGEDGKPTVYIETHEMPGYTWCLRPNELVTVLVSDEPGVTEVREWHLLERVLAALVVLVCVSIAVTTTDMVARVLAVVAAVLFPAMVERRLRQ